jgi:two-component system chemotaxis sensor kinase CheA
LRLTFARDGDAITATLSDDGTGIDPARIHHMAVERGLLDQDAVLSDDESALRLIFEPGFSTAAAITDLSGRGVGMDAVQAAVTRLRGTIAVESKVGSGTSFHMRFPAHALTTQLLVVEIDGDRFGIPFEQVRETLRIDASAIKPVGLGQVCVLRGSAIPVVDLAGLLGLPSITAPTARLVVTHVEGSPVALRVGNISLRLDTVIRPHGGVLGQARGMLGSAIMGDGSVLLVLDVQELLA